MTSISHMVHSEMEEVLRRVRSKSDVLYVLRNKAEPLGRYKVGVHKRKHKDTESAKALLIREYTRYIPQVKVEYFNDVSNAKDIESQFFKLVPKERICNDNGNASEWVIMRLEEILGLLTRLLHGEYAQFFSERPLLYQPTRFPVDHTRHIIEEYEFKIHALYLQLSVDTETKKLSIMTQRSLQLARERSQEIEVLKQRVVNNDRETKVRLLEQSAHDKVAMRKFWQTVYKIHELLSRKVSDDELPKNSSPPAPRSFFEILKSLAGYV